MSHRQILASLLLRACHDVSTAVANEQSVLKLELTGSLYPQSDAIKPMQLISENSFALRISAKKKQNIGVHTNTHPRHAKQDTAVSAAVNTQHRLTAPE